MPETDSQTVRFRQRRRTRAAIVNATAELLRSGRTTPGVSEIAEAADVSRRTAYQYFPTVDQILLDATLGLLSQTPVDNAIAQADPGGDASGRVSAMIRALTDLSSQTMPLGRSPHPPHRRCAGRKRRAAQARLPANQRDRARH